MYISYEAPNVALMMLRSEELIAILSTALLLPGDETFMHISDLMNIGGNQTTKN